MLQFAPTDNAVFAGLEAEGPWKGLPTLFIVGEPQLSGQALTDVVKAFMTWADVQPTPDVNESCAKKGQLGLYFGAGGSLRTADQLFISRLLTHFKPTVPMRFVIEGFELGLDDEFCKILWQDRRRNAYEWIIPYVWMDSYRSYTLKDPKSLDIFNDERMFKRYLKVYIEKTATLSIIDPLGGQGDWQQPKMWFADYVNNVGEFQSDILLWKEEACQTKSEAVLENCSMSL